MQALLSKVQADSSEQSAGTAFWDTDAADKPFCEDLHVGMSSFLRACPSAKELH